MPHVRTAALRAALAALALVSWARAAEPPAGAAAFWRFDEGQGAEARDAAGQGRNGRLSSVVARHGKQHNVAPAWVEGIRGKALDFQTMDGGFGPFVTISDGRALCSPQVTVCLWMKMSPDKKWKSTGRLVSARDDKRKGEGWLDLSVSWLRIRAAFGDGKEELVVEAQEEKSIIGHWTHVAFAHDGRTARLYVNGELKASRQAGKPLRPPTAPLTLGNGSYPSQPFLGALDEIIIYPRALSADEVVRVMEATAGE
ncbi:MAG TPA: LamG domain-containing protein [Candidatus Brocadiia bacterium]|nr:LamG domain-containing protein [Candidatus Brocadiia bacterium]